MATLLNLNVLEGELSPAFNSDTYVYSINIIDTDEEITLTATPTDPNATVTGDGIVALQAGFNMLTLTVTAQDGATTLNYVILVNRFVNINEPNEEVNIAVYPNPTSGELRIENGELGIKSIEIFDVSGRKQFSIFNFQFSIFNSINISHFPAGIYFVNIKTEKGVVTKKVVKQ